MVGVSVNNVMVLKSGWPLKMTNKIMLKRVNNNVVLLANLVKAKTFTFIYNGKQ